MPRQLTTTAIAATSELPDVQVALLKRRRYAKSAIAPRSQLYLIEAGRQRHLPLNVMVSKATTGAKPRVNRRTTVAIAAKSEFDVKYLATLLPTTPPTGELLVGDTGDKLAGSRLIQGSSLSLRFIVSGKKIGNLPLTLTITRQDGTALLNGKNIVKQTALPPLGIGGIMIDSNETNSEGVTTLIGLILLYPHETALLEPETEVKFQFVAGRADVRLHLIESGSFFLYQP